MADALAVLGLTVTAEGAIAALNRFDAASEKVSTTATKTAARVAEITQRSETLAKATRITSDDLGNSTKRYEAMIATMQRVDDAQKRVTDSTQAIGRAHAQALVLNERMATSQVAVATSAVSVNSAFDKLRPGMASLAANMLNVNAVTGTLAGSLGQMAVGGAATVGILAGVAAIGALYESLTEKTRKVREEQDKATKSLLDFAKAAREGIGGKLRGEIEAANAALERSQRLQKLAQTGSGSIEGLGAFESLKGVFRRTADYQKEQSTLKDAVTRGEDELRRVVQDAGTKAESQRSQDLAALIASNRATLAERQEAVRRLSALNQLSGQLSTFAGGSTENADKTRAQRLQAIADAKALNDALNPSNLKEQNAETKLFNEQMARSIERFKAAADSRAILNKAFRDGQKAIKDAADAESLLRTQQELNGAARAQELADLKEKEKRAKEVALAMIALRDLNGVGMSLDDIGNANIIAAVDATNAWGDALREVSGITQSIAGSFGDVGRNIASGIAAAQQLAEALQKAQAAQAAARAAQGTANAASTGAASGAATAGFIGAVVGVIGGVAVGLLQSAQRAREAEKAAAIAQRELIATFNESSRQYLRPSGLDGVLADLGDGLRAQIKNFTDAGGTIPGNAGVVVNALVQPPDEGSFNRIILKYNELVEAAKRAAAFQDEQAQKDLGARLASAQGRAADAEAIRQQIADERELEAARVAGADAARLAYIEEVQIAEARRRAAEKAEADRRSVFDITNATNAFGDPRGAAAAAFQEAQARRMADAISRGASEAEKTAIALYNVAEAADRLARIAEADLRTTESLTARALTASGNTRGGEDAAFAARQRQEMVDAIREGMTPANQALLRFTQLVERSQLQMQRAIEDGTKAIQERAKNEIAAIDFLIEVTRSVAAAQIKAIDEQIKAAETAARETAKRFDDQIAAVREQTKAQLEALDKQQEAQREALQSAQAQVAALDRVVQQNSRVVDALTQFTNSLQLGDLSTLSPAQKVEAARAQFDALASSARGGNADAAVGLPGAAQALLQASRAFNASNSGFVSDSDRIRATVAAVQAQYGATLPSDQQQLANSRAMVEGIQAALEATNRQRELIQSTGERTITLLQEAKDKASADAQRVIDNLRERREQISADADATIKKLEENRKAIQDAADRQVAQLILVEQAAHQTRIRQDEYWTTFLGLTRQDFEGRERRTTVTTPQAATIPQDQLTEQRRTNAQFETLITAQSEELGVLRSHLVVTAAASKEATALLSQVVARLDALAGETRRSSEGAAL